MNKLSIKAVSVMLAAALVVPGPVRAEGETDAVLSSLPLYELGTLSGTGELGAYDGPNDGASYRQPLSVAAAGERLYVADAGNQRIRVIDANATSTAAGVTIGNDDLGFPLGSMMDGGADEAAFQSPSGLAVDSGGRAIIADAVNNAVRALSPTGRVTTIAGTGGLGLKDGAANEALFDHPLDVAVTDAGVIYVADTLNHVIRKIENGVVSTLNAPSERVVEYFPGAVEPAGDYADGPLTAAKFNEPSGLALDSEGNLYVSDTGNHRIRYIDFASGTVSTVAGGAAVTYGQSDLYAAGDYADGAASEAAFHAPRGIAVTPDGGLLIADSLNHAIRYLKGGEVYTVAGVPGETSRLDGVAAYAGLNVPTDVVWLGDGAFAVADAGNNRVRIVKPYELPAGVQADGTTHLLLNDEAIATDADPVIVNGTTFVPVRVVSERLGYTVDYNSDREAVLQLDGRSYTVTAGTAAVGYAESGRSESLELPEAPFIVDGRLLLPVRFFAEQIDLDVQWLGGVKAVLLRDKVM